MCYLAQVAPSGEYLRGEGLVRLIAYCSSIDCQLKHRRRYLWGTFFLKFPVIFSWTFTFLKPLTRIAIILE